MTNETTTTTTRTTGTLITTYRGYDIRESPRQGGISMGVEVFRAGEYVFAEMNVALAKSHIDCLCDAKRETPATVAPAAQPATEMTAEQRKARAAKLLGRRENNPSDLI